MSDVDNLKCHIKKFISTEYNWNTLDLDPLFNKFTKAAILFPLTLNSLQEIEVLLTKRSQFVRHDKGHICFPGGMYDQRFDKNEIDTALREAHEEIGMEPSSVEVIGTLIPFLNNRQILITPVVGFVASSFVPIPNSEVEFAFKLPLSRFLKASNYNSASITSPETNITYVLYCFHDIVNENKQVTTFGVTAMILVEVAAAILKKVPEFDESSFDVEKPMFKQTMVLKSLIESWKKNEMQGKL